MSIQRTVFAVTGLCLAMAASAWADVFNMVPGLTSLEFVTVGNPGNAGEWAGESYGGYGPDIILGSVDYTYKIGKFEVTTGQYTEFLNAVASADTYGLYNIAMWSSTYGCKIARSGVEGSYTYSVAADRANRPVNYVSWGDAARFANWLTNGMPTGAQDAANTEDGSYVLNGAVTEAELQSVVRRADARYVIPSEDEWYKAAYYEGDSDVYYDYPTGTDSVPSYIGDGGAIPDPDPGNYATYDGDGGTNGIGSPYWMTEVGEHENSESPYGTFDQGGNVSEWNEAIVYSWTRGHCGGSFDGIDENLAAGTRSSTPPTNEHFILGFRVAEVPEPATLSLLAFGCLAAVMRRRK